MGADKKAAAAAAMQAKENLGQWLTERLRYGEVPRLSDAYHHARASGWGLTRRQVSAAMRLHESYMMSAPQQRRGRGKGDRYGRPVVATNLGQWHADIGFISKNARYETPKRYSAGFLVAKDVLSRYVYAVPLEGDRTAKSIVRGFEALFETHRIERPGETVISVSFDRETSVLSRTVQEYLKKRGVAFHAFRLSRSKAKHAESAIRQIRTTLKRLESRGGSKQAERWWNLLPVCVAALNARPIAVNGRRLAFAPRDVTPETLPRFKRALYRAAPHYYYSQYDLSPEIVGNFRFAVGDLVRVKKIVVSSAVIGEKRSEQSVSDELFAVEKQVPYVTGNMRVGRAYLCRHVEGGSGGGAGVETFEEDDLVPGRRGGQVGGTAAAAAGVTEQDPSLSLGPIRSRLRSAAL